LCVAWAFVYVSGDEFQERLSAEVGYCRGLVFNGTERVVLAEDGAISIYDARTAALLRRYPHLPPCKGAKLGGATGLSKEVLDALGKAGAKL
jgi:hypothetical protein